MYQDLLIIKPRLIPQLRERSRNTGPAPPVAASSGYVFPAFIVMDKGESLRDFVAQTSDADMAWHHALHALCVLAKQMKVRGLRITSAACTHFLKRIAPCCAAQGRDVVSVTFCTSCKGISATSACLLW